MPTFFHRSVYSKLRVNVLSAYSDYTGNEKALVSLKKKKSSTRRHVGQWPL